MGRRFTLIFSIFSGLLLVAILWYSLHRLDTERRETIIEAESGFSDLVRVVESTLSQTEAPLLPSAIDQALSPFVGEDDMLRAVAVYTEENGVEYIWAAEGRYLSRVRRVDGEILLPGLEINSLLETTFRRSIRQPGRLVYVEAAYDVVPQAAVLLVMRDALIGVGGLVVLIMLVIAIGGLISHRGTEAPKQREAKSAPRAPAADTARSAEDPHISMRSGVTLEVHLIKRLSLELERAAFNDQDLTLIVAKLPGLAPGSSRYRWVARLLLETFKFEDLIFEYGQDSFAVVLTNTDLDQSIRATEEFQRKNAAGLAKERIEPLFGMSSRNGRLIEGPLLLKEANAAIARARRTPGRIVGFRPDPQRYRQHIASRPPVG
jgi:GGDEF domain-containing protein